MFRVIGVQSDEVSFQNGEFILPVQQHPTSEETVLPRNQEVLVGVDKRRELRVSARMVIDYGYLVVGQKERA